MEGDEHFGETVVVPRETFVVGGHREASSFVNTRDTLNISKCLLLLSPVFL